MALCPLEGAFNFGPQNNILFLQLQSSFLCYLAQVSLRPSASGLLHSVDLRRLRGVKKQELLRRVGREALGPRAASFHFDTMTKISSVQTEKGDF